jgi:hypothetical protein
MNLDFWYNLVYVVFGNLYVFLIVMGMIIFYYSIIYDIPKWIGILFFSIFGVWFAINEGVMWILGIVLIGTGFFIAIEIMRRMNN